MAGTVVCEPISVFTLDTTVETLDAVIGLVARSEGVVTDFHPAEQRVTVMGTLPHRRAQHLALALPDLSRGEGVLAHEPDHHQPLPGRPPERVRSGPDPLDTDTWLRERPR
ncbi:MAG: hypothetical protein L0G99_13340 [Propionibacteriales bacterium]|nr:hypothetical protein [Propionibacteriales bacterium]